jgi:hypothetical protein
VFKDETAMKPPLLLFTALACASGLAAAPAARAQEPPPAQSFAFVVGANRGGPSQQELRYAEDDARRIAEVVTSLGRYPAAQVRLLLSPTRAQLLRGLDELARELARARSRGGPVQVLFYYSGHARANAINLGAEELPLSELRERLVALPSTITIATLDACQSGSFSRIKGAEATADFSFNSINRLTTAGIAVMASSSGTELSQESEQLRSSYFTHHLLVGLRGAGDADRDGRVTLFEAYRYAYHRTLVDTAATAVGSQHATLELGLRGKGEVVLTYPAEASSRLALGAAVSGQLLVHRDPGESVVAELHKAAGEPLAIALPPGRYVAVYRKDRDLRRCTVALGERGTVPLDPGACPRVDSFALAAAKGAVRPAERWGIELGIGASKVRDDQYFQRLRDFGFHEPWEMGLPRLSLAVARLLGRHTQAGVELALLDDRKVKREGRNDGLDQDQRFRWTTAGLGGFGRLGHPLWRGRLFAYLHGGLGIALGISSYKELRGTTGETLSETRDAHVGYWLKGGAGLSLMPWKHVGFHAGAHQVFAPAVSNLVGDVHDSGGFFVQLGVRGAL